MVPSIRPIAAIPAEAGMSRRDLLNLPAGTLAQADALFRRADRSGDGRVAPEEMGFGLPVVAALRSLRSAEPVAPDRGVATLDRRV
jgi:hypothetical protein